MRLRTLGWPLGVLALAFVLVLSVPGRDRPLALFAFLLLAGAIVALGLVAALARLPGSDDRRLGAAAAGGELRPAELEAIESEVRAALAGGGANDGLRGRLRSIAAARLSRDHAIDLDRGEEAARRVIADDVTWQLVTADARRGTRVRLGAEQLVAVVDRLERL